MRSVCSTPICVLLALLVVNFVHASEADEWEDEFAEGRCDKWVEPQECGPWGKSIYTKTCCGSPGSSSSFLREGTKQKAKYEKCLNYKYTGTEMRECFGASGDDCNGITELTKAGNGLAKFGASLGVTGEKLRRLGQSVLVLPDGTNHFLVPTSVGSIYHDTCCVANPHGFFCNGANQPYLSILQPSRADCPCSLEWNKAVYNLFTGRWWHTRYKKGHVSDHTPTHRPLPPTILPRSLTSWSRSTPSSYELKEVKATSLLRAPPGTKLDCPGVDKRCLTGFLKFNRQADDYEDATVVANRYGMELPNDGKTSLAENQHTEADENRFAEDSIHHDRLSPTTADGEKNIPWKDVKQDAKEDPMAGLFDPSIRFDLAKWLDMHATEAVTADNLKGLVNVAADHAAGNVSDVVGRILSSTSGGIIAGDSVYCASGKFESVHFRLSLFKNFRRYGICA